MEYQGRAKAAEQIDEGLRSYMLRVYNYMTTGLALTWPGGMPLIRQEWVAAGTAFYSGLVQVTCPLLLALTRLKTPFGRGVAIGSTAHVGGMVALMGMVSLTPEDAR